MDSDDDEHVNGTRQTRDERLQKALKILRDGRRISLLDFILHVLQLDKAEYMTYRNRFFSNPSGKLSKLLDCILENKQGRAVVLPQAIGQRARFGHDREGDGPTIGHLLHTAAQMRCAKEEENKTSLEPGPLLLH